MELGQLRAIRELGDRGSIAAVAAALHVTPSSVSQQISALQRHSSVPLTFRAGRRTALTDAGRALAAAAVEVEMALERAEQAVSGFQGDRSSIVSVAAFHSAGLAIFGPLLAALNDPNEPDVRLTDFDVAQRDFPALTADHDLVLAHRLVGTPAWPATVHAETLLFEPLDIAMRRGHRLASKASIHPADLRSESWVTVHEGFPLEQAIIMIAGIGGSEARVTHRINEFSVAASVVAESDCVGLIPRFSTDLRDHPELVLRPLSFPEIGRYIDCLARPETLERINVKLVLAQIASITKGLTQEHRSVDKGAR
jgi:DNA-binding transcriptional LysR family regulator